MTRLLLNPLELWLERMLTSSFCWLNLYSHKQNHLFYEAWKRKRGDELFFTRQLQKLLMELPYLFPSSTPFRGEILPAPYMEKVKLPSSNALKKSPNETRVIASLFYNTSSSPDSVERAGEDSFLLIYQVALNLKDLNGPQIHVLLLNPRPSRESICLFFHRLKVRLGNTLAGFTSRSSNGLGSTTSIHNGGVAWEERMDCRPASTGECPKFNLLSLCN